jgi:hypothetical protein
MGWALVDNTSLVGGDVSKVDPFAVTMPFSLVYDMPAANARDPGANCVASVDDRDVKLGL